MNPKTPSLIRAVPALGLLLLAVPAWAAFTDNLNGTVTDDQTGLMWDQCSWGQTWVGPPPASTCLGTATNQDWAAALALAVTANTNNHRGYNDWRLPSKNELESLVDIAAATLPAIDTTAFPSTPGWWYWSSTTWALDPASAWFVHFRNGDTYASFKGFDFYHVRLVRSGQSFDSFDLLEYPITTAASPAEGGTLICDPNPVNHGSSSTCTATPSTGYSFANWAGSCTGTGACTLSDVTAAQSVTANFTLNTYPITTAASPAEGGTLICDPNPVPSGGTSTCTATPSTGYSFANWDGDCTGTGTCTLSDVTAAKNVTAVFRVSGVVDIPTVGPWGLALLTSLLAGLGGLQLRRGRRLRR